MAVLPVTVLMNCSWFHCFKIGFISLKNNGQNLTMKSFGPGICVCVCESVDS